VRERRNASHSGPGSAIAASRHDCFPSTEMSETTVSMASPATTWLFWSSGSGIEMPR